jgi:hypothetical protein
MEGWRWINSLLGWKIKAVRKSAGEYPKSEAVRTLCDAQDSQGACPAIRRCDTSMIVSGVARRIENCFLMVVAQ